MTASALPTWAADRNYADRNPAVRDQAHRDRAARQRTADYERVRYQRRQDGDWAPFTDTNPVRHHLQALREAGLTLEQIGGTAGVSVATLVRAMKADRMTSAASNAIMAITPPGSGPARGHMSGAGLDTDTDTDTDGDRRQRPPATVGDKLQTLTADGWTQAQIAAASGLSERAVYQQIHRQVPPMRSTTAAIDRAYNQLVDDDPGDGYIAARARLRAERSGWQPSTPPPEPADIDEVAVDRAVAGERLPLRPAEQHSVLTRLAGSYPDDEIGRRLGLSARTVLRHRSRNQLPAYTGHPYRPKTQER